MWRTVLILLGGLIIISLSFFLFRDNSEKVITNSPSSGGNDFVSLLSDQLGEPIVNLGRGGDTTGSALSRINTVLEKDPKVVIVLLGGNDFIRKIEKEQIRRNLAMIIERVQEKGAIVLLLGVQNSIFRDSFKKEYENLRDEYGTAYVENVLEGLIGHPEFMDDAIHPNSKGYKIIADRIYPVLKKLIK
jgi:acyl-CoA thioesterase I